MTMNTTTNEVQTKICQVNILTRFKLQTDLYIFYNLVRFQMKADIRIYVELWAGI